MEDTLFRELVKVSILGPVLAVASWYIWRLHKDLEHAQNQRTADVQATLDKVLSLNDKWNSAIGMVNAAMESQRELLGEIKDSQGGLLSDILDSQRELLSEIKDALRARR